MATVYRVETAEGYGPYQNGFHALINLPWMGDAQRPNAIMDKWERGFPPEGEVRFGFTSVEQLFHWFADWLNQIAQWKGSVVVYEVPESHVYPATKQCVFKPEEARVVKRLPADQALKLL